METEIKGTTEIPNALPAIVMRKLMLGKCGLDKEGTLYVGTGGEESITVGDSIYKIPKVQVVEKPQVNSTLRFSPDKGVYWDPD